MSCQWTEKLIPRVSETVLSVRAGITDGTRLGTAILFFSFMHVAFRSRMSILPFLLLCLFKNSRQNWGDLFWSPKPAAEVQVSRDQEPVWNGFFLLTGREVLDRSECLH